MRFLARATLFLSLSLAGCSESHAPAVDGAASDTPAVGAYAGAYVMNDCGPADGRALRLILWTFPVPECSADPARPSLEFYLYGSFFPITPGATITVTPPSGGGLGDGSATACPGGTPPCRTSQDFTLTFATFTEDAEASGTYSVRHADGTTDSGSFAASWCEAFPPICG